MSEDRCLNCEAKLNAEDRYCHVCGQRNRKSRITIKQLASDFLGDYFTFDSKLFRSLFPLLFKPGFLTKEFLKGRRVRYIPPLRMYIFVSIIYFFVMSINVDTLVSKPELVNDSIQSNIKFSFGGDDVSGQQVLDAYENNNEEALLDSTGIERNFLTIALAKQYAKQYVKIYNNPSGFAPQILKIASVMMFFIMPVFAFFLFLLYYKKNNYYIDHLIFSFHFHSFLFIMGMILYFLLDFSPGIAIFIVLLIVFMYLYKSLRNVYGQSRGITIIKMGALLSSGVFILLFALLFTMLISFLLF
jgi:hypothetical protein